MAQQIADFERMQRRRRAAGRRLSCQFEKNLR
jgi:hypothetical protein